MRIRKGKEDNLYYIGMQILSEGLRDSFAEIRKGETMTTAKQLIHGSEDISRFLYLTDDDVASMVGLSAETLGEVPPLADAPEGGRGENFGDAHKWLGRTLGWFHFAAVSLRNALDGAETEDALRERLGKPLDEGASLLARILHAVASGIRHASGPFSYLTDGNGMVLCKHADRLLAAIGGESYHRLKSDKHRLTAEVAAAEFAFHGAKAALQQLVPNSMEANVIEGLGHWNGAFDKNSEVAAAWDAWVASIRMKEEAAYHLSRVQDAIAVIAKGVAAEIQQAILKLRADGRVPLVPAVSEVLEISPAEVETFGAAFIEDGSLKKVTYA